MSRARLEDQHLFMKVFEHAPIGMTLVAPDGRFMKVNQSVCRMLGYSKDELIGLTSQSITYPGDLDEDMEFRRKAIAGEIDNYHMEIRYIHKSGEIKWGLLSVTVERDEHGDFGFFISQLVDITESKKEQEKFQQLEKLHRLISDNSKDILYYSKANSDVQYISPAIKKILGYNPDQMVGKSGLSLWHPDDLEDYLSFRISKSGVCKCRVRHIDGHYVWFEIQINPVQNEFGDIIAVARDITERIKAERLLEESEQRHKSLMKYTPIGICAVNLEGLITEVNPAFEKMTGYPCDELCAMSVMDLALTESIPFGSQVFQKAMQQELTDLDLLIKRKDGHTVEVSISSSPIIVDNRIVGVYILNKDLTMQKQTEEILRQAEKLSMVGELAAGIAHEIRNPLTSLRGFVQIFQKEDLSGEKKLYHDVMLSEIDRINEIVSELLVLAKPSNETYELSNMVDKLNQVVTLFEGQANLYNVQIIQEIDRELPLVRSQSTLKQVFINILKNAIEAMPKGGEVLIQAKQLDDKVMVRITDKGCGISQDQLSRIGTPFFTTKETGTGLGFMVSQRIIQNHKGTIRIESEIGKGTTVEILLPSG